MFKIKQKLLATQGSYSCVTTINWVGKDVWKLSWKGCAHSIILQSLLLHSLLSTLWQYDIYHLTLFAFFSLDSAYFNHSDSLLCPCKHFTFFFFFWLCLGAYRILISPTGCHSLPWKHKVLITESPGKSLCMHFNIVSPARPNYHAF